MSSINKVIIIGRLGQDPESRYMPNGDAVCNLRVATSETWKDKNTGEKKEATEWHRIVIFRKLAEIAAQYLQKGAQVYVEGSLKTRKWQDKDGQDRYTTEIVATEMRMLGQREGSEQSAPERSAPSKPAENAGDSDGDFSSDIPF